YLLVADDHDELPKAGMLGVSILDGANSLFISGFASNSAAQTTGIDIGDHILALNGVKVSNMMELKAMMFDKQPGDRVQVTVRRNGGKGPDKEMQFEVT